MIQYIEDVLQQMSAKAETATEDDKVLTAQAVDTMKQNLEKLKPVIEAHDKDYQDLQAREQEMERLLHEFKNSLMIEKIKMNTWENKQKQKNT